MQQKGNYMSAFLGPIHYWLYNKIQLQQSIIDELCALGVGYGISLQEECETRYGTSPNRPLEDMIDHNNIHGWLQERVSQVECKYAYSITRLIGQDRSVKDKLKVLLHDKGSELGRSLKGQVKNAPQLFKVISDNLLDGMPCDHANRILSQDEIEVIWTRSTCVHSDYWEEVGGDIGLYYELREDWTHGLAEECGFTFEHMDEKTFRLKAGR